MVHRLGEIYWGGLDGVSGEADRGTPLPAMGCGAHSQGAPASWETRELEMGVKGAGNF